MQLDSYLEIFTTMYGWAFANIIGEAFTGTGLVVLPFMIMAFNAWRQAKEQGAEQVGVFGLVDSIGTQLIVGLFVFMTCFATSPLTSLHSINLRYRPPATVTDPNPVEVSRDSGTGSTYDSALVDSIDGSMSNVSGSLAQVPAWWMSVMAISSGINNAIKSGLSSNMSELRAMEELARIATIEDPRLLNNIQRFYSECFVPAQSRFIQMPPADLSVAGQAIIAPANTDYGPDDTGWMGSQLFRTEPGFYTDMRSGNPVNGFVTDFGRDADYYNPSSGEPLPFEGFSNPDWGRPTCKEWWEDTRIGLREAMITHSSSWSALWTHARTIFASEDRTKDELARLAQYKANPQFVDPTQALGDRWFQNARISDPAGIADSVGRNAGGIISNAGLGIMSLLSYITAGPLKNGLLMMQALILMGMYMFLPLVTFFSGYNLKVMLYGAVGVFTVKFWGALWTITVWVDAHMIRAMYPEGTLTLTDLFGSATQGHKRMLLNLLMLGMFIGLPVLWTGMMAWIGININASLTDIAKGADSTARNITSSSSGRGRR
jgi:hypothetical protein